MSMDRKIDWSFYVSTARNITLYIQLFLFVFCSKIRSYTLLRTRRQLADNSQTTLISVLRLVSGFRLQPSRKFVFVCEKIDWIESALPSCAVSFACFPFHIFLDMSFFCLLNVNNVWSLGFVNVYNPVCESNNKNHYMQTVSYNLGTSRLRFYSERNICNNGSSNCGSVVGQSPKYFAAAAISTTPDDDGITFNCNHSQWCRKRRHQCWSMGQKYAEMAQR